MKKLVRFFGAVVLTVSSFSVNAALVDYGLYTTDNINKLDWLDLTVTKGLSYSSALAQNNGWRLATNEEVENLFSITFDGYYNNYTTPSYGEVSWSTAGPTYLDQYDDVISFHNLLGITGAPDGFVYSYGLYTDENDIWRIMGVESYPTSVPDSMIFGLDYYQDLSFQASNGGYDDMGIYLVRTSVVPVPSAVWLFGSGLLGLVGLARRKT